MLSACLHSQQDAAQLHFLRTCLLQLCHGSALKLMQAWAMYKCCAAQAEQEEEAKGQGEVVLTPEQQAEWARLQGDAGAKTAQVHLSLAVQ